MGEVTAAASTAASAGGSSALPARRGRQALQQHGRGPAAPAAAIDLDGGAQQAGVCHGRGPYRSGQWRGEVGFDPAGVHLEAISPHKVGVVDDGAVKGQHRGHAFDLELAQRTAGAGQGLFARGAGDDELGHERIERAGHDGARLHARIQRTPGPEGASKRCTGPGVGKSPAHIFGIDAELKRVAQRRGRLRDGQRQAIGHAQLLHHQVHARGLLGHRGAPPAGGC